MSDLFTITREWVKESFGEDKMPHFDRTVYWVEQFKPNADEAFRIAAIAHDMERPFRTGSYEEKIKNSEKGYADDGHLKHHQEEGARLVAEFLKKHQADDRLIDRVSELISKHEVGGNEDQTILKDADSVSFLETQIDGFLKNKVPQVGKEKVRDKFNWMFERITSDEAKAIARPLLEQALQKLNQV